MLCDICDPGELGNEEANDERRTTNDGFYGHFRLA